MDTYLRSHIVSSRIADAHAAVARRHLAARTSRPQAVPAESLVGRIAGALRIRALHRPLSPRVEPR